MIDIQVACPIEIASRPVGSATTVPPAVVALAGVRKEYAGGVRALDGVDLTIAKGELAAIVGPSGSGKSTMLQIVGCLDRPTSGTVHIDGRDVSTANDKTLSAIRGREIGFVFQQFHLVDALTAAENVATPLIYQRITKSERRRRALTALARVGLEGRATHRPSEMSGGERQRVAIARALVTEPSVILADEPTGNLDSKTGDSIMETFRSLHQGGATVVLITHDRDLAAAIPRVISLKDGRIVS